MAERSYIKGDRPVPDYRLVKFLGKGGFGEVWKAVGPGGIEVALKIIPLDNKQGFKEFRAIRMVKNVRSAHLVPIIGFWLKDSSGNLFDDQAETDSFIIKGKATELIIAMGLGEKSLMDRLEEYQKEGQAGIPTEDLLEYMTAVAKAIDYLNKPIHNSGSGQIAIQHCDVKPQNIMIVGGEAQLCDFGLARVLGDPRTTQSGNMMMSVPYTSPEMFEASKPSHSSDQYALAVTYYELRTGELPFDNPGNPASMMYQIMQGKLDFSRLTDPAEREVMKKATARDPTKRYPTSVEMVKELRRIIEGTVSTPPSKPTGPKPPPGPEAEGTEIVPGYRLIRRLGQGGYGTVWEANAPGGKRVAIKIIHDVQGSSGRQEFRALQVIKSLDHEHLLDLHAYWLKDKAGDIIPDDVRNQPNAPPASTLVIATKLAAKNLLQRLSECQREGYPGIPVDELLSYMRQAAQAIDFLNEPRHRFDDQVMSIQHRDIKPENILLVGKTAKVGDFGLAKVLEGTNVQVHGSSTGYTPHYAAPELFRGEVTRWTDQYSLAITYYKLRTGRLPFEPNISLGDLLMMHLEGHLDLSALSEAERAVVARATAQKAEERYPTCLDMVQALERSLTGEVRQPPPPLAPTNVELELPPKSSKPSGPPRRSTQPVAAADLTITPGHEGGQVLVTTPEQEPAPLEEELVDWHMDTQEPARKTPVPEEEPPALPDWRNGGAEKSVAEKVTPSKRPPASEKAPDWRKGQRRRRKAPVALLATVVLIAGAGVTGLSIYFFTKPASPPTNGQPRITEADIESQIANKQFGPALKSIDDGTFDADKKKELREKVLRAWLQEAQNQPDPKDALAQTREILKYFPDNGEARAIAEQAAFNASIKPPQRTPEEVARETLVRATASLGANDAQALRDFKAVDGMAVGAELKTRAKLGQARAQARLGKWDEVRLLLTQLPQGGMATADRALRTALQLKADLPAGANSTTEENKLVVMLDQLIPLQSNHEFWSSLEGQQEGAWTKDLGKQVVRELLAKITDIRDNVQEKQPEDIDKALKWAAKLASYDQAHKDLAATTKEQAVEKLVYAAGKIPREEVKNPLLSPWKDHGEEQVFKWLSLAYTLAGDKLPEPARKDLIVAAGACKKFEDARKVLQQTPVQKKKEDIPCLLVKAKAQPLDSEGYKVAFQTYADLLDLVLNQKDIPLRERKSVLESALASGERAVDAGNTDLKRRLADCYLAKVKLMQAFPGPGLWANEPRDLREAYADAARHWPSPEILLDFSKVLREQALGFPPGSAEQREQLRKARDILGEGPPKHPRPDLVYYQRGLIREDLAEIFKEKEPDETELFQKAVQALAEAARQGGQAPPYLLALGRCQFRQALPTHDPVRMTRAREALAKALAKGGLTAAQQAEAHYWSAEAWQRQKDPDYLSAQQEFEKTLTDIKGNLSWAHYEETLRELENLGRDAWRSMYMSKAKKDFDAISGCCLTLIRHAPEYRDKYAKYERVGLSSLAVLAQDALNLKVCNAKEVFAVCNQALGNDLTSRKDLTFVPLINKRNLICVGSFDELKGEKNFPSMQRLIEETEFGVKLANQINIPTERCLAHLNAMQCYVVAMNQELDNRRQAEAKVFRDKALFHVNQALALEGKDKSKELQDLITLAKKRKEELGK